MKSRPAVPILAGMKRHLGFTIFELMITIAVLAVGLAIGVPRMQSFVLDNRIVSQLNTFNSALALARSEAVKQNELTVVCVSSNGEECEAGRNWSDGWIVFVDRNPPSDSDLQYTPPSPGIDGCADGATDDCLVAVEGAMTGDNTLEGAADVPSMIVFNGMGIARCNADGDDEVETCEMDDTYFTLCDFRGAEHARALTISQTGRTSPSATTPTGDPLECP